MEFPMHNPLYYEAKIQLRPGKKEFLDFVKKKVRKKGKVFISKVEVLKEGIDVYLSSWRFAISLGKMLKKRFGGKVCVTRKLFSRNARTSKKIYRVTVLFRS